MSYPAEFTANRSSPTVTIGPADNSLPALRGTSGIFLSTGNANNLDLTWPAGTAEGDMAVIFLLQGYGPNLPLGWTQLYNTNNQSGIDGGAFYKILDSTDIAAGGVNVTFAGSDPCRGAVAVYENGSQISIRLEAVNRNTGSPASVAFPFVALATTEYLVFGGQWGTGAITFDHATVAQSYSAASYSAALGRYIPGTNGSVTETVFYANSSQTMSLIVAVTTGGKGRTVSSSAISAASVGSRWAVGRLYFEVMATTLTGTPSVGLINWIATFGASTLGGSNNAPCYQSNGQVRMNNATLATIMPFVQGDNIGVAYDPGLKLIWFRVNGGSWNNSGTADPATGAEGIDLSNFDQNRFSPAVGFSTSGSVFTGNFAVSDFDYSPPAGFNSIEEVVVTSAMSVEQNFCDQPAGDMPTDWFCRTEVPTDNHSRYISFPAGPIKTIAGEVRENDIGVEGKLVRLYNKRTGEYVGEAITNATGDFVIPTQDPNLPHFVVAFDDPDYNAKVYDNVMPQ